VNFGHLKTWKGDVTIVLVTKTVVVGSKAFTANTIRSTIF
jgi:hypothetical protein